MHIPVIAAKASVVAKNAHVTLCPPRYRGTETLHAVGNTQLASPAATTQDADPFELSASCVGVVPSLAPAEFCTTLSSQRHQNVFDQPKASPLNVATTMKVYWDNNR